MYGTVQLIRSVSTAVAPELAARIRSLSVFTPRNLKKNNKNRGMENEIEIENEEAKGKKWFKVKKGNIIFDKIWFLSWIPVEVRKKLSAAVSLCCLPSMTLSYDDEAYQTLLLFSFLSFSLSVSLILSLFIYSSLSLSFSLFLSPS